MPNMMKLRLKMIGLAVVSVGKSSLNINRVILEKHKRTFAR